MKFVTVDFTGRYRTVYLSFIVELSVQLPRGLAVFSHVVLISNQA